ncbi:MAG: TonB-dependent receptor [Chitinophagaceae bacterium]|nr:MAG: TonB-dependent receptor [Chitinophagaceae bacterium]
MKKVLLALVFTGGIAAFSNAYAQHLVKGSVKEANGSPVIDATVGVKGTTTGTTTDANGNFSLSIQNPNATLIFSSVGYTEESVPVNGRSIINVILKQSVVTLNNLVVIGYGSQKKSDLSSAIASVNVKQLQTNAVLPNAAAALEGAIPGVSITTSNGSPGAGINVHIRGTSTFGDTQPLVIIDGAPGDLNNLNPSDIASIQVLKDAAAAAIYGSRAANGVIIVTTKKGKAGQVNIDANVSYGIQTPEKFISVANAEQYATIDNALHKSVGLPIFPALSNPSSLGAGTNWQKVIYGNAPIMSAYLGISGGSQNATYRVSGGYNDQEGIARATWYKKALFHFNGQQTHGPVTFGESVSWNNSNQRTLPGGGDKDFTQEVLEAQPIMPVYDSSNEGGYGGAPSWLATQSYNPLALLELQDNQAQINDINLDVFGEVHFLHGFTYRLNTGYRVIDGYSSNYLPTYYTSTQRQNIHASLSENRWREIHYLVENTLNYQRNFGKNSITALAGFTTEQDLTSNTSASAQGFPNNSLRVLGATTGYSTGVGGGRNQWDMVSLLGRLLYSYSDKYYLTANIRRDGSSEFGQANRYGVFPSVSAAWRISSEPFFESLKTTVQNIKLRASYGVLGNQPGRDYAYIPTVTYAASMGYPFGGGFQSGAAIRAFANPDIKWESTKDFDIGIDANFLTYLSLTLDYYIDKTDNVLLPVPIPPSTGTSTPPVINTGRLQNKGFEADIAFNPAQKEDGFNYSVSLHLATIKNTVDQLGFANEVIYGNLPQRASTNPVTAAKVGYPIGGFFVKQADGLFQSQEEVQAWKNGKGQLLQPAAQPGDVRYVDINGDGIIDGSDVVYAGSPFPKVAYGANFSANYKNFDFSLFVQGTYGNKMFDTNTWLVSWGTIDYNFSTDLLNAWTPQNTGTNIPRLEFNDPNHNADPSTRFLYSASYLRFKTVQIGYTFPKPLVSHAGITGLRIYVSTNNLWTITKYPGYDPSYTGDGLLNRGLDQGQYPVARTFTGGLSVSF